MDCNIIIHGDHHHEDNDDDNDSDLAVTVHHYFTEGKLKPHNYTNVITGKTLALT